MVLFVCCEGGRYKTSAAAIGGVRSSVGVEPQHCQFRGTATNGQDFSVSLYLHFFKDKAASHTGGHGTRPIECRIQAAIRIQADDNGIEVPTREAMADHNDLAIRLHGNALAARLDVAEIGQDDTVAAAKAGVEGSIGVEPQDHELVVGDEIASANSDQFAVRLQRQFVREFPLWIPDIEGGTSAGTVGRIQRAIRVVSGDHREIAQIALSQDDNLAVGLHRACVNKITVPEHIVGDNTVGAKTRVQRAVSIVGNERLIPQTGICVVTNNDEGAVSALKHRSRLVISISDTCAGEA